MEFRLWVGIWTAVFLTLLVMFNLSFLVKYITRFTEDCFATLVAIIFIIDAIKSTVSLRNIDEPVSTLNDFDNFTNSSDNFTNLFAMTTLSPIEIELKKTKQNSIFLFSIILFVLTFVICSSLKEFRSKPYLPSKVGDFSFDFFLKTKF